MQLSCIYIPPDQQGDEFLILLCHLMMLGTIKDKPMPTPPLTFNDEAALLEGAQRGDVAAFTTLVRRHQSSVRAFLAVRMAMPMDAEDLAQEVFITAFHKMRSFDISQPFAPWLRGIALNLWRNHQRKFRAIPIGGNEELQALLDVRLARENEVVDESRQLSALRDCLDNMEGPARELLQARYSDGASIRDLAEQTGRNHSTLTMQLHRLRSGLATCMESKMV
jgi:RNA polymerase sigma-70 factor (ECF subfamily)